MEANEPDKPLAAQALEPLGSLSQSARENELKRARGMLIGIGVLTMAVNGYSLYHLPTEIQQAIQQNQIAPADVEPFRRAMVIAGTLIYGAPALLGVLFVVFGLIIKKYPVPITIASLVLYVLAIAAFGILFPETLANGFIMKIIIIFILFQAIRAARAFQAHARKAHVAEELLE